MKALPARTVLIAAVLLLPRATAAAPLDLADLGARPIQVEFETSSDLTTVGAVFSDPVRASYSAAGGLGTVVIAGEDYEGLVDAPGLDISDITIQIDLATRAAEVVSAGGTLVFPPFGGFSFSWTLDSTRMAGFVDAQSSFPPLHCVSQAQVDAFCPTIPQLCGATCVLVPGAPYDPATGKLNMVGFEHQDGCGETGCLVVDMFSPRGDLRLSEASAAPVPATSPGAAFALAAALLLAASRRLARPRS